MDTGKHLRRLIEKDSILVLPGTFDAVTAKLAEQTGFEAVFTSGFGISATTLGLPDLGFLDGSQNLYRVRQIIKGVNIPLIADMDTGYGNALNVRHTVKECFDIGVSGLIIEDQEWPKKCGHMSEKKVVSTEEALTRIKAATDIRDENSEDLIIIARTDAREPLGMEEAINRGKLYEEAGADVVFVEAPESKKELRRINEAFSCPTFANMLEGGKTPYLSYKEVESIGFDIVVYPLSSLFASSKAIIKVFKEIKQNGKVENTDLSSFKEFEELMDTNEFRQIAESYSD